MKPRLGVIALVGMIACSSGGWAWRRADGSYDPKQLDEDIDACEEYRRIAEMRGPFTYSFGARPRGGWGSPEFEFCMSQRDWKLQYVR